MMINPSLLIFAALLGVWFGAALFYVAVAGPAAIAAGPSGVGFLQTLARRRGTGPFYAVLAFATVMAGIWMYVTSELYPSASASNVWATLSLAFAILALSLGASANRIAERKWVKTVKHDQTSTSADQDAELVAAFFQAEKVNIMSTAVLGIALICLVLSRMLP